jgi:hypothetical protein
MDIDLLKKEGRFIRTECRYGAEDEVLLIVGGREG